MGTGGKQGPARRPQFRADGQGKAPPGADDTVPSPTPTPPPAEVAPPEVTPPPPAATPALPPPPEWMQPPPEMWQPGPPKPRDPGRPDPFRPGRGWLRRPPFGGYPERPLGPIGGPPKPGSPWDYGGWDIPHPPIGGTNPIRGGGELRPMPIEGGDWGMDPWDNDLLRKLREQPGLPTNPTPGPRPGEPGYEVDPGFDIGPQYPPGEAPWDQPTPGGDDRAYAGGQGPDDLTNPQNVYAQAGYGMNPFAGMSREEIQQAGSTPEERLAWLKANRQPGVEQPAPTLRGGMSGALDRTSQHRQIMEMRRRMRDRYRGGGGYGDAQPT